MTYMPPRRSDGTIQHARLKQLWPQGRPFRILSIDGGGTYKSKMPTQD